MIICPNCHHQELDGAIFCSECGARFAASDPHITITISQEGSDSQQSITEPAVARRMDKDEKPRGVTQVSLMVMGTGKVIPLSGKVEFTLGRISEGQPILPDIDLSDYEAYSQGVSRLHASIKITNQRVVINDLGSANGTRVNGQKIMPHIDYPVNHGDVIALGKFRIQVSIQ